MNVFQREADAILKASYLMDDVRFAKAVDCVVCGYAGSNKVVVTGVGKSAIAARKIASTFATCGIPAVFIDPIGLYHGELGAISRLDTVILVSHSGETEELLRLLPYFETKECLLIPIVATDKSKLGQFPLALYTHVTDEAFYRIPTASFMATVAIGDALAIQASIDLGMSEELRRANHPGGTIGMEARV